MILPNEITQDDRIVFVHVPKTAGTSVNHYFQNLFGRENVGWLGINITPADLESGRRLSSFRVIGGHFTRWHAERIPGRKIILSTIREPISRVLSYHRHILNRAIHPLHTSLSGDLETDLRGRFGKLIKNEQCKFLSGSQSADKVMQKLSDGRSGLAVLGELQPFLTAVSKELNIPTGRLEHVFPGEGAETEITESSNAVLRLLIAEDLDLYARISSGVEVPPRRSRRVLDLVGLKSAFSR